MGHHLKISFLTPSLGCGGAEWWIHALVNYLDPHDFTTEGVAILHTSPVYDPGIYDDLKDRTRVNSGEDFAKEIIRDADIVIAWGLPDVLRLVPPGKFVVMVSHCESDWFLAQYNWCEQATGLVAVGESSRDAFPSSVRSRVTVIRNGVDQDRLERTKSRYELLESMGISPEKTKVVLMVGRVSTEKNCSALPRTIAALPEEWIGIHVGSGFGYNSEEETQRVKQLAQEITPNRVFWVDTNYELGNYYGAADVFLQPSYAEGCSYTILEAIYMGLPVFVTPVGLFHGSAFKELAYITNRDPTGEEIASRILSFDQEFPSPEARIAMGHQLIKYDLSMTTFIEKWSKYLMSLMK